MELASSKVLEGREIPGVAALKEKPWTQTLMQWRIGINTNMSIYKMLDLEHARMLQPPFRWLR